MEVKLAKNFGFCFGVKRAIEMAEEHPNSKTLGPLIHNPREIGRLKEKFRVTVAEGVDEVAPGDDVIIEKETFTELQKQTSGEIIDATCPFVKKPQEIVEAMSGEGYDIVIFGDIRHPEVKGVKSYATGRAYVVETPEELDDCPLKERVAIVSQTTKKEADFTRIVEKLVREHREVRVFNTICNATFENQTAADELSREVDVMLVVGGKNSSNTRQLHKICLNHCADSYLIEGEQDIQKEWFDGKKTCGITAGASTPGWIIDDVVRCVRDF